MVERLRKYGIWSLLIPIDAIMLILLILLNMESRAGVTLLDTAMKVGAVAFAVLLTVGLAAPFILRLIRDWNKPPPEAEVKVES
jgi:hypothetical protein